MSNHDDMLERLTHVCIALSLQVNLLTHTSRTNVRAVQHLGSELSQQLGDSDGIRESQITGVIVCKDEKLFMTPVSRT